MSLIDTHEPRLRVAAEVLPGKIDPNASGRFVNSDRATQYAKLLVASGDYTAVYVIDADGTAWQVTA